MAESSPRRRRGRQVLTRALLLRWSFQRPFAMRSIELLVRCESADPALLPDDVAEAAARLRALVNEHGEESD